MGISRELVIMKSDDIDDLFDDVGTVLKSVVERCICSICNELVEDPILLTCEHFYCRSCIYLKITEDDPESSEKTVKCPDCKVEFNPSTDVKPPSLFMRNVLAAIRVRCSLDGCEVTMPYNSLREHVNECLLNPDLETECTFCHVVYRKADEINHIDGCEKFLKSLNIPHSKNPSPFFKDSGKNDVSSD